MMEITIRLYASLRYGRQGTQQRSYQAPQRVAAIAADLGIAPQDIGIVLVDGVHAPADLMLTENATVSLMPRIGGG